MRTIQPPSNAKDDIDTSEKIQMPRRISPYQLPSDANTTGIQTASSLTGDGGFVLFMINARIRTAETGWSFVRFPASISKGQESCKKMQANQVIFLQRFI